MKNILFSSNSKTFLTGIEHAYAADTIGISATTNNLDTVTFGEKLAVGIGRGLVNIGQGVKQLGLQAGVKLNIVEQKILNCYTNKINAETDFYAKINIGNSITGKIGKIGAEMLLLSAIPCGAAGKLTLMESATITGIVTGGIMPVADGSMVTRVNNAAIAGGAGALGGYVINKTVVPMAAAISNRVTAATTPFLNQFKNYNLVKNIDFNKTIIQRNSSPAEIHYGYGKLSRRQELILQQLPKAKLAIKLYKFDINVRDLAALTAHTGDEFALFSLGSRRIVVRGNQKGVVLRSEIFEEIKTQDWRWSAHTHPGTKDLVLDASGIPGDRELLQILQQNRSLILHSVGRRNIFDMQNNLHLTSKAVKDCIAEQSKNFKL